MAGAPWQRFPQWLISTVKQLNSSVNLRYYQIRRTHIMQRRWA